MLLGYSCQMLWRFAERKKMTIKGQAFDRRAFHRRYSFAGEENQGPGFEEGGWLAVLNRFTSAAHPVRDIERREPMVQADEGVDEFDAHRDGAFALQDVGGLERAVLCDNPGQEADVAFGCGHIL